MIKVYLSNKSCILKRSWVPFFCHRYSPLCIDTDSTDVKARSLTTEDDGAASGFCKYRRMWLVVSICRKESMSKCRMLQIMFYGILYCHRLKYILGHMVVMPKRPWIYPVTIWINSIPVMTTLSGNIVAWLGSDVISNKYGNNGSQCCKVLEDLQGNLIRLCDRFEINSCPNCIYTIYSCLSDGL